ncbi:GNAT family N-acetyltransferase [Rhodoferax sp.]|uniref:GNAT family N-acetyltransferase n=1 Tax=Rhodoferax sp. TaxID=50421 RepID=UPI0027628EC3|nr:GNAT family N-acetyltransferase [Rhodoferax sp.]
MSTLPSLRAAQPDDAGFIYRVIEETMRTHVEATWGAWVPGRVQRESAADACDSKTRIIQLEGEDCGVFYSEIHDGALWVRMLFVMEKFQRRGVGRHLLSQAQSQASAAGVPIRLRVLTVNPAKAYYEAQRFRVYQEEDDFLYMERAT